MCTPVNNQLLKSTKGKFFFSRIGLYAIQIPTHRFNGDRQTEMPTDTTTYAAHRV